MEKGKEMKKSIEWRRNRTPLPIKLLGFKALDNISSRYEIHINCILKMPEVEQGFHPSIVKREIDHSQMHIKLDKKMHFVSVKILKKNQCQDMSTTCFFFGASTHSQGSKSCYSTCYCTMLPANKTERGQEYHSKGNQNCILAKRKFKAPVILNYN
ncbi:uncharacterized protein [Euphorbia lathyris]|uniref:uncharacterized protein n=1 Tax=Euphorbia lathyris TaxID=212925 RepID=UPI0033144449